MVRQTWKAAKVHYNQSSDRAGTTTWLEPMDFTAVCRLHKFCRPNAPNLLYPTLYSKLVICSTAFVEPINVLSFNILTYNHFITVMNCHSIWRISASEKLYLRVRDTRKHVLFRHSHTQFPYLQRLSISVKYAASRYCLLYYIGMVAYCSARNVFCDLLLTWLGYEWLL